MYACFVKHIDGEHDDYAWNLVYKWFAHLCTFTIMRLVLKSQAATV